MINNFDLKDYAHIYAAIHCGLGTPNELNVMTSNNVITTILTQYHVSKGIKVFGNSRIEAVMKELKKMHDRLVMQLVKSDTLTPEKKGQHYNIYVS